MDGENSIAEENPNSLLEVDRMFFEKIQARNSFVGQSTRLFHSEREASVPFGWEAEPGTPKHPQTEEVPPLKPPPWMHSQSLEKPSFDSLSKTTLMSCFWKKSRKNINKQGAKPYNDRQGHLHGNGNNNNIKKNHSDKCLDFPDVNKDVDTTSSLSSADHSRSSSSSSSISNSPSNTTNSSSSSSGSRSFAKGFINKLSF